MPKLKAKEVRQLAWNDLRAGQYWSFVGGHFVLTLICLAFAVAGIIAIIVSAVFMSSRMGDIKAVEEMFRLEILLPTMLFSCIAAVPLLYSFGYMTWGQIRMALAAANHELKFEHCLSGWGHGWKMCWTVLVATFYLQFWFLLLIVPGIVKAFSYAMTTYVQVEHPDWTSNQCITESRRLMDGNKWRYFCLNVSFIGWWLLVAAASVVPVVGNFAQYFLIPYSNTAGARFYCEVKREKAAA